MRNRISTSFIYFFLSFVLSFASGCTKKGDPSHDLQPEIFKEFKCGYVNKQGVFVVEPNFDGAGCFSNGLALVRKDGLYGYINTRGKMVTKLRFDDAFPFVNGFGAVRLGHYYGYINTRGKMVIKPEYIQAGKFQDGYARVKKNIYGEIDTNVHFIPKTPEENNLPHSLKETLVDTRGRKVIKEWYDEIGEIKNFRVFVKEDGKWGMASLNGKVLCRPSFDLIESLKNGYYKVTKGDRIGIMNPSGEVTIKPEYSRIVTVAHGLVKVSKISYAHNYEGNQEDLRKAIRRGPWGLRHLSGKVILAEKYEEIDDFVNGYARVVRPIKKSKLTGDKNDPAMGTGYIDTHGRELFIGAFSQLKDFYKGMALVCKDDKWGYVSSSGRVMITPRFEEAFYFSEGLAVVKSRDKYGFINRSGRFIIPPRYDMAKNFSQGLAPVQKNGKWGYINPKGRIVVKFKYDTADPFSGGRAVVTEEKSEGEKLLGLLKDNPIDEFKITPDSPTEEVSNIRYFTLNRRGGVLKVSSSRPRSTQKKSRFKNGYPSESGYLFPEEKKADYASLAFADPASFPNSYDRIDDKNNQLKRPFDTSFMEKEEPKKGLAAFLSEKYYQRISQQYKLYHIQYGCDTKQPLFPVRIIFYGFKATPTSPRIEARFTDIRDFFNGRAKVKANGKWGIIDKTGKFEKEPSLDSLSMEE